jgi:hypothetical protein
MRIVRWCTAGGVFGLLLVGPSRVATAQLTSDDGCKATASWTNGLVVNATQTGTVEVPRKDTIQWEGSVTGAPGPYHGSVWIELPPPFGKIELHSWKGTSSTTSNAGQEKYSIPKVVPGGAVFRVAGEHIDANGTCAGSVDLSISGGVLGSPVTWVALGGTAVSGVGLAALLRPLFKTVSKGVV